MLFWRRPDVSRIDEVLREQAQQGFTHEGHVRMTRGMRSQAELEAALHAHGEAGDIFDVDHLRVQLGSGRECYDRAKQAVRDWKMFDVPAWLEICWPHSSIREGETLGTLILNMGFYSLTACRIVYTIDEEPPAPGSSADDNDDRSGEQRTLDASGSIGLVDEWGVERFGFAYGTLPCHLVAGEERFLVEWDKTDDSVWYEVLSFSKPQHWMAKVGYPVARWFQEQYHQETAQAMLLALQDDDDEQEDV